MCARLRAGGAGFYATGDGVRRTVLDVGARSARACTHKRTDSDVRFLVAIGGDVAWAGQKSTRMTPERTSGLLEHLVGALQG
jgi:hypothetical protein